MVIVTVALIFNYKKIVEFIDERKKLRIKKLSEALKCEHIQGLTKAHLEEELATEQFKITTGIGVEKEFREAIIKEHRKTNGELAFFHFKRALPHLEYRNKILSAKISHFELSGYWFNLVFGFFLAFFGLLIMVLPSQIEGIKIFQIFSFLGMGAFFLIIAIFMLYQTMPVYSAKKVIIELEKTHNNSNAHGTN